MGYRVNFFFTYIFILLYRALPFLYFFRFFTLAESEELHDALINHCSCDDDTFVIMMNENTEVHAWKQASLSF